MRIQEMLQDDDAVSPVIGVILMVAITVILAAVIASFVLGLGPGEAAPTATFDVEYEDSTGGGTDAIVVTHNTGSTIAPENVEVQFGDYETVQFQGSTAGNSLSGVTSAGGTSIKVSGDEVGTGDWAAWSPDGVTGDEVDVTIVWTGDGQSSELDSSTVTIN